MFLDFFVISVYDIVALESFWCRTCSCVSSWLRTCSLSSCCCASLLIHLCEELLSTLCQFFFTSFDLSNLLICKSICICFFQ